MIQGRREDRTGARAMSKPIQTNYLWKSCFTMRKKKSISGPYTFSSLTLLQSALLTATHASSFLTQKKKKKTNSMVWVREWIIPTERRLSVKWLPTFADRGCHMVSVTDPYDRILGFSRQQPLLFYQVAPQLYSRDWVDYVPDPRLFFFLGSAGNWNRASGSVAKNSDHWTTEAVSFLTHWH
jgi:hypothetical protein